MKLFYSKKAVKVVSNWPYWIVYGLLVSLVGVAIAEIAKTKVVVASLIPSDLEDEVVLASRFYNSEKCFAYEGEVENINTVHTRIIDSREFNQRKMNRCFAGLSGISKVEYAFSLSLTIPDPDDESQNILELGPIETFNWGTGDYASEEIIEDVFVMHEGIKYNGKLRIRIKNV
jgi:hypothetical protein